MTQNSFRLSGNLSLNLRQNPIVYRQPPFVRSSRAKGIKGSHTHINIYIIYTYIQPFLDDYLQDDNSVGDFKVT